MDVKDLDRFMDMVEAEFRAAADTADSIDGAMPPKLEHLLQTSGLSAEEIAIAKSLYRPEPPVSNGPGPFRSMVLVAMPTSLESARERYAEPAARTLVADLRRQGAKMFGPLEIEPNDDVSIKIIAVGRA